MKKYIFLTLSAVTLLYANNVDYFAHGLAEISLIQPVDVWKLIDDYEGHQQVINKKIKEERIKKDQRLLAHIKKSKPEQLLIVDPDAFNEKKNQSILYRAIEKEHSLDIIKELIEKAPELVDPNIFNTTETEKGGETNDFYTLLIDRYFDLFLYGFRLSSSEDTKERVMDSAKKVAALINATQTYKFKEETSFFDRMQNKFFRNMMQVWPSQKEFFNNYVKIWKKYDDIIDPSMIIFKSIVERSPDSLRTSIPRLINQYLVFENNKNRTVEEKAALKTFLQYAINTLPNNKEEKFEITEYQKNLTNKDLNAGESYTLKEILEKTGLQDLLK